MHYYFIKYFLFCQGIFRILRSHRKIYKFFDRSIVKKIVEWYNYARNGKEV